MQLSRQQGGSFAIDTRTLCMGEESCWVKGLEDIRATSVLFPHWSSCDHFVLGDKKASGEVGFSFFGRLARRTESDFKALVFFEREEWAAMAHAAAHIKKARSEMDPPPDLKALEKARERRRRSRERAERKRKVPGRLTGITILHFTRDVACQRFCQSHHHHHHHHHDSLLSEAAEELVRNYSTFIFVPSSISFCDHCHSWSSSQWWAVIPTDHVRSDFNVMSRRPQDSPEFILLSMFLSLIMCLPPYYKHPLYKSPDTTPLTAHIPSTSRWCMQISFWCIARLRTSLYSVCSTCTVFVHGQSLQVLFSTNPPAVTWFTVDGAVIVIHSQTAGFTQLSHFNAERRCVLCCAA